MEEKKDHSVVHHTVQQFIIIQTYLTMECCDQSITIKVFQKAVL